MERAAADGGGSAVYPHGALYAPVHAPDGELGDGPREAWPVFDQDVASRPVCLPLHLQPLSNPRYTLGRTLSRRIEPDRVTRLR